jgi:hypothetical protein
MERAEGLITFLKCIVDPGLVSITDLEANHERNAYIDFYLLPVGIFNSWIIALDPFIVNELRLTFPLANALKHLVDSSNLTRQATFAHAAWSPGSVLRSSRMVKSIPAPKTTI